MTDSTGRNPQDLETPGGPATGETPTTEAAPTVDAAQNDADPDVEPLATLADDGDPLVTDDAQEATEAASSVNVPPDVASVEEEQLATLADDGDPLVTDDAQEATEPASNVTAPSDDASLDVEQLATLADDGDPLVTDDIQGATEAASNVNVPPDVASVEAEQLATLADDGGPTVAGDALDGAAEHEPAESALGGDPATDLVAGLESTDVGDDFKRPAAEVKSIVEALIFASPDPLTPKALLKLLDNEPKEDVLAALDELKQDYERPGGLQLVEVAGGFQIVTRADLNEWVRRLFHERSTQKLSVQALESLAVIAYRQPITAIEITEIRGVNTSGVLNTLLERHLIKIVGRKQVVGRPFMYATTKEFLIRFGLKDLSDLPKVEDMAESLGIESRLLVEQTPAEEQLPLSEPDPDDVSDDSVDATDVAEPDASESSDDDPEPSVH